MMNTFLVHITILVSQCLAYYCDKLSIFRVSPCLLSLHNVPLCNVLNFTCIYFAHFIFVQLTCSGRTICSLYKPICLTNKFCNKFMRWLHINVFWCSFCNTSPCFMTMIWSDIDIASVRSWVTYNAVKPME